jgi:hypothetical protein
VFEASYWKRIKLPNVHETPQETANETDYRLALARASLSRDKALVAVLWSSGMRRAEVARMRIEDLDLDDGAVVVPITKGVRSARHCSRRSAASCCVSICGSTHTSSGPRGRCGSVSVAPSVPTAFVTRSNASARRPAMRFAAAGHATRSNTE